MKQSLNPFLISELERKNLILFFNKRQQKPAQSQSINYSQSLASFYCSQTAESLAGLPRSVRIQELYKCGGIVAQQQLKDRACMQADHREHSSSHQQQSQQSNPFFKLQLNNFQAAVLNKLLPHSYSFQLDPKTATRHASDKLARVDSKPQELKRKTTKDQGRPVAASKSSSSRNQRNNNKINEELENGAFQQNNTQKELTKRNSLQGIADFLKPCIKILNLLKNSRTSWPFREPVDTITLGIPNYSEIIKEPMDLSTIENNLRANQYLTPTQFHADISKIITNSYTFNSSDMEFTRITAEFESYYKKITEEPEALIRGQSIAEAPTQLHISKPVPEKKPKKESTKQSEAVANTVISMNEKKELGMNIKKLPKEHMKGILDIVNEGKVKSVGEFDLKELDTHVIRKLQAYVKEKLNLNGKSQYEKAKENNNKEESSFQIDEQDQS